MKLQIGCNQHLNIFLIWIHYYPLQMHQSLEARLSIAEEMRKAVEQERLDKEKSARKALAEQNAIMEKVLQESKILKEEAEENSKVAIDLTHHGPLQ